jgi:hypothetical protein
MKMCQHFCSPNKRHKEEKRRKGEKKKERNEKKKKEKKEKAGCGSVIMISYQC